jgi:hypothetical protein
MAGLETRADVSVDAFAICRQRIVAARYKDGPNNVVIFPRNGWVAERRTNNIDYSRVASVSYDEWIVNILCIRL